jgi:CRISPR system Cascade subunit CasB
MSRLLEALRKRKEDRGFMADLRCALVEGKRYRAWPHLGFYGGIGESPQAFWGCSGR